MKYDYSFNFQMLLCVSAHCCRDWVIYCEERNKTCMQLYNNNYIFLWFGIKRHYNKTNMVAPIPLNQYSEEDSSPMESKVHIGYNLYWWSPLEIILTISNFAATCQLTLIRVLIYC